MKTLSFVLAIFAPPLLAAACAATSLDREAENRSRAADRLCVGIPADVRTTDPLLSSRAVVDVAPLRAVVMPKAGAPVQIGAVVRLRATPGMTREWLQREIDCHIAADATATAETENGACPLALADGSVTVSSTGSGFAVAIPGRPEDVADLLARANRLLAATPDPDRETPPSEHATETPP
ncbi:MAG: hypothetical protein U0441_17710 [Polyangiaceae bacterium]